MSRRAENLRRKRQRKIMLIRKYIRFTFCCVLIVVLAFAINYLKKNMNNISEGGNSGGNNVKKIKESKEESAKDVIKNYAEKHGYTLEDYPENIKKLFERNKETKDFVLKKREKHTILIFQNIRKLQRFRYLCNGIRDGVIIHTQVIVWELQAVDRHAFRWWLFM